jgi:hypothetical protein
VKSSGKTATGLSSIRSPWIYLNSNLFLYKFLFVVKENEEILKKKMFKTRCDINKKEVLLWIVN